MPKGANPRWRNGIVIMPDPCYRDTSPHPDTAILFLNYWLSKRP